MSDALKNHPMTFEQWLEKYKPIQNILSDNPAINGLMFETYGNELLFVQNADQLKVWTVLDADDNSTVIANGFHHVNRVGYIVTEVAFQEDFLEIMYMEGDDETSDEEWRNLIRSEAVSFI